MSNGCVLMNCQYWDGDSLICTSLSDICVYQPDGTEQLQSRIAELEGALEEKIYPKCNCDKCTGSGIDALYD